MKKISNILFMLITLLILSGCNNSNNGNNNTSNIEVNKTSTIISNTTSNTTTNEVEGNTIQNNVETSTPAETTLYEFLTPLKSNSSNRLNNIQITCTKLNEKTVAPGEEFSFCNTIGPSTEADGYKKADIIVNKKTVQALGGGNCQVSTTLYNAVLGVPTLTVTERHPHGKKVNYVPEGKDAAIAHGSKDLKFINNSDKTLKIYSSTDGVNVYVKLVSIN